MFTENGSAPNIEVMYPAKRSSPLHPLMWPAALLLGALAGISAFYNAQRYYHDTIPVMAASASDIAKPQVPSAYALLQGSTPEPTARPSASPTSVATQTPRAYPTIAAASSAKPLSSPR